MKAALMISSIITLHGRMSLEPVQLLYPLIACVIELQPPANRLIHLVCTGYGKRLRQKYCIEGLGNMPNHIIQ